MIQQTSLPVLPEMSLMHLFENFNNIFFKIRRNYRYRKKLKNNMLKRFVEQSHFLLYCYLINLFILFYFKLHFFFSTVLNSQVQAFCMYNWQYSINILLNLSRSTIPVNDVSFSSSYVNDQHSWMQWTALQNGYLSSLSLVSTLNSNHETFSLKRKEKEIKTKNI